MKIIWEEEDIVIGMRFQKPDCGITGSHMVGYEFTGTTGFNLCWISLADGMSEHVGTKQEFVRRLNHAGCYVPVALAPGKWMAD